MDPFAKPLHVTAVAVPSSADPDPTDHWGGEVSPGRGGSWRKPWSPTAQADWLEMFYRLALSKPFVATVCWRDLADHPGHYLPHGGLCSAEMKPKPAHDRLRKFRLAMNRRRGKPAEPGAEPDATDST